MSLLASRDHLFFHVADKAKVIFRSRRGKLPLAWSRPMRLRSYVLIMTAATLLPIVTIACAVVFLLFQKARDEQMQSLVGTARALSLALDRSFESAIATLEALARSENLQAGDLRSLNDEAKRFLAVREGAQAIMLVRPSGEGMISTDRPFGAFVEPPDDLDFVRRIVKTRSAQVGDLVSEGGRARIPLIYIGVPVISKGEARYALIMKLSPRVVQELLEEQDIPADWTATVIDRGKVVVARTRDVDSLLGKPASPALAQHSAAVEEGWWMGEVRDNRVYVAHRRSDFSGWTVALAMPVAAMNGPLWQALGMIVGGMTVFLLAAIGLATIFGRRVVRSIHALSAGAQELARGGSASIQPSPVFELDQVREELESAAAARRAMEASLRQSEARLRTIIDTEPECVKVVAADGRLLEMNRAGLAMFQADSLSSIAGRRLLDFVLPEHREAFAALHQKVMSGASGALEFEIVGLQGRRRWLETRAAPLRGADGRVQALLGVTRDVTERKLAEDSLRRARDELEERVRERTGELIALTEKLDLRVAERTQELASSRARLRALVAKLEQAEERERRRLAGELHDYLAQMLSASRMALDRARRFADDGELKELLDDARRAINSSIDYTRTLIAELSPKVLYDFGLPAALQWLAEKMRRHGLKVRIDGSEELSLDEERAVLVFQCVRELLWNVVKHAETDSACVSYRLENDCLTVVVSDEGRGFASVALADKSDPPKGFGLLSIQERFELQGGRCEIASSPMKGTRVRLTLPIGQMAWPGEETKPGPSATAESPPGELSRGEVRSPVT